MDIFVVVLVGENDVSVCYVEKMVFKFVRWRIMVFRLLRRKK